MAGKNSDNIDRILGQAASPRPPSQVFLVHGERFLCRQAAGRLTRALLAPGGTLHGIDGDEENPAATLASLRGYSLLPGRQVFRVMDTRLFLSKNVARGIWNKAAQAGAAGRAEEAGRHLGALLAAAGEEDAALASELATMSAKRWKDLFGFAHPGGDMGWIGEALPHVRLPASGTGGGSGAADQLIQAMEQGLPPRNFLVLVAETADRRTRLYRHLKKAGAVIDLSVDSGASARARRDQEGLLREQIQAVLRRHGKDMPPRVMASLVERVGFHPQAAVMETEKLCLHAGQERTITQEALDALVGRTRQDAVFELSEALGRRDLGQVLLRAARLRDAGVHPLALIRTLHAFLRTLLLLRVLLEERACGFSASMTVREFSSACLPRLKEDERWGKELSMHPFALLMRCKTAMGFAPGVLARHLGLLLDAEMRLKGSGLDPALVLEHMFIAMLAPRT